MGRLSRLGSWGVMLMAGAVLLVASPSWAELECGAIIPPGTKVKLTKDLKCGELDPFTSALTLQGPGTVVNLGGYSVDCENAPNVEGIILLQSGVTLKKGTVTRCSFGVLIDGDGGHTVTKVKAKTNLKYGFITDFGSNANRFTYNTALNTGDSLTSSGNGFDIRSADNTLKYNTAKGNGDVGFWVRTLQLGIIGANRIEHNVAIKNGAGFTISQTGGIAKKNVAFKNRAFGFQIESQRLSVVGNLAKANGSSEFPESSQGFVVSLVNETNLVGNTGNGNIGEGFLVESSGHTLKFNTAVRNGRAGIRLDGATVSTVRGNLALANKGRDLVDEIPGCDNNTWKFNFFKTRNQDCIR